MIAHATRTDYRLNTALQEPVTPAIAEQAFFRRPNGYSRIALVGFSLGGNITLKYLGEAAATCGTMAQEETTAGKTTAEGKTDTACKTAENKKTISLPSSDSVHKQSVSTHTVQIVGAVAVSVPCDLAGSTKVLERRRNRIYMERFLKTLRQKIHDKHKQFPAHINIDGLSSIRTFREFDDRYTAPLHGFRDADHYWHTCSCLRVIENIAVPTLLLNAADDPFLSAGCFPQHIAEAHRFLHLEVPPHGGHVGFVRHAQDGRYYSELRACEFLDHACKHDLGYALNR